MEPGEIFVEHSFYSMEFFIRLQYLSQALKRTDKNYITTLPSTQQSIL